MLKKLSEKKFNWTLGRKLVMKVLEAKEKRLICIIFMVFYNCSRLAFDVSALT